MGNNAVSRLLSMLGMARRANRLCLGFEAADLSIKERKSRLLLVSEEISNNTLSKLRTHAERQKIRLITVPAGLAEFGKSVGQKTGIASVLDEGFSEAIEKLAADIGKESGGGQLDNWTLAKIIKEDAVKWK